MYHLLDREKLGVDSFNAYGAGGQEGMGSKSPTAAGRQGEGVAEDFVGSSGTGAKTRSKDKGGVAAKKVKSGKGTQGKKAGGATEEMNKDEMRRLGLYAAFLLPLADSMCLNTKGANVRGRAHGCWRGGSEGGG